MNRKTVVGAMLLTLAVVTTAGVLYASNMGFKLNYQLNAPQAGVSKTGLNTLALPDNRQSTVNNAKQLMDDIGFANVENVQRFTKTSNTFQIYTGRGPGTNFNLLAGEGYYVKMLTSVNYIVVGSDDPALATTLDQPGGASKTGLNLFAYNYHQTAAQAKQLMDDVGFASVENVQRFAKATNTFQIYTGRGPGTNFNLLPGEGYYIKMLTTTSYTPSHY